MTDVLHVSPIGDLLEHDMSTDGPDCSCGPSVEAVFRPDGSNAWLIVHHPLDGKESA